MVDQPKQNGKCFRTVCERPHANLRHKCNGRLYCQPCAIRINRENEKDARELGIHPLIEPVTPAPSATPVNAA